MPDDARHRAVRGRVRRFAKQMRHAPTNAEAAMWRLLRGRRFAHFKFRRQAPVESFILDFVCFERRLIVEIDGSQHGTMQDQHRDRILTDAGFLIVRYWDNDVLQRPLQVSEDLFVRLTLLQQCDPSPGALRAPPSPARGEG